jgi:site-specific DNA-methyltransferase (adenine-specific)
MSGKPFYTDHAVTLYRGDALAVLRDLPDASADALITDPPYSSGGMVRGDRMGTTVGKYVSTGAAKDSVDFAGDNRDQRAYAYWCALWLAECLRVVRPAGVVLVFTDWRQLPSTTDALQAGGWVWRGIVPWAKGFGGQASRTVSGRFASQCEYVVWGSRGELSRVSISRTPRGPQSGSTSHRSPSASCGSSPRIRPDRERRTGS